LERHFTDVTGIRALIWKALARVETFNYKRTDVTGTFYCNSGDVEVTLPIEQSRRGGNTLSKEKAAGAENTHMWQGH
jgi:hypothetical protein